MCLWCNTKQEDIPALIVARSIQSVTFGLHSAAKTSTTAVEAPLQS